MVENNDNIVLLPAIGSWRRSTHSFSADELEAIEAATLTKRPLLIRGEPGLGKSQIARAIAKKYHWPLITTVINARAEVEDLLYRVDHIARLSDANRGATLQESPVGQFADTQAGAQTQSVSCVDGKKSKALENYIDPGPVWRALALSAGEHLPYSEDCMPNRREHDDNSHSGVYETEVGCVLLIDEIDKAHADVPNALLEVLNSGQFLVQETNEVRKGDLSKLMIVITANAERGLPAAFLRRCAVLRLTLGNDPEQRLVKIAKAHMESGSLAALSDEICLFAAHYVVDYRAQLDPSGYRPGTSEYLDLLQIVAAKQKEMELSDLQAQDIIKSMGQYVVMKSLSVDSIG